MANVVASQILENGYRELVMRFTNFSDGTAETGVTKVDATDAATYGVLVQGQNIAPGLHLKISRIQYDVSGMGLRIQWHATTNADIWICRNWGDVDFGRYAAIQNPGTAVNAGATGSIDFTTIAAAANSSYSVILTMTKGVPQS